MLPPAFTLEASSPNLRGRDFVVGDIHGRFDRLDHALQRIGFDPTRDRLFSVGDLLDRDKRSYLALDWLRRPWFHAIMGNHELFYLHWRDLTHPRAREAFETGQYFTQGVGGSWVTEHGERFHAELEAQVRALPTLRALSTRQRETVLLVHAQLPEGARWPQLLSEPWPPARRDELAWGRTRWKARDRPQGHAIPGVAAVVVGHTTVTEPTVVGSMLYLDTGGWHAQPRRGFTLWTLDQVVEAVRAANATSAGEALIPKPSAHEGQLGQGVAPEAPASESPTTTAVPPP